MMLAPLACTSPPPDSLWRHLAARAGTLDAPVGSGPLARDLHTDVAVIGAGYSGLAAAYALEKRGVPCVVLDANPVGWGASGRNGGVVSDPAQLQQPELKEYIAKNPEYQVFANAAPTGRVRPINPSYNAISQALWTEINAALKGQETPQQALARAAQKGDAALKNQG